MSGLQEKYKKTEQYQNAIFNAISSGVYIVDPETKEIVEINDYALEFLKYKREELLGKKCHEIICTADKTTCLGRNISDCFGENERVLLNSSGREIPVVKTVKEIALNGKKYILETFADLSKVKEHEEKDAEREEILQATLEATDDGILVLDEEFKIINSNKQFFEMWKTDSIEFVTRTPFKAVRRTFLELNNAHECFKNITEVVGTDKKLLDLLFFRDGRIFERYSAPVFKKGTRVGRVWRFKDVTPQAKAERKLKKLNEELESRVNEQTAELRISERRLKEAQEIAHIGNWLFDLETKHISGSDNIGKILGLENSGQDLPLSKFLEVVHPDDIIGFKEKYLRHLRKKTGFNFVHRIIKPDGNIVFLRQKCKTFYSQNKKPLYSLGIAQDITEQRLANIALKHRERQLNMAMEGTGLGLWDWNMINNTIKINKQFAKVIGYEGVINENEISFDFLISIVHKDDYDRVLTRFLHYTQANSNTFEEDFRLTRPDDSVIWVSARAKVFEWHIEKPLRSIGTFVDVTERRLTEIKMQKSEEKFRKLTELSPSAICIQSINKLLFVNRAWVEALGYSEKDALEHSFVDLVHPDDQKLAARYSKLRLLGSTAPNRYEIKMLTKKNETKWFDISVSAFIYEGQKASLAVLNDITKIKMTEQALRESEEQFKSLFFGNHSVMLLVDAKDGRIIEANQAACDFYKFPPPKLKSLKISQISLSSEDEIAKSMNLAIEGKQNFLYARHQLANNEIRHVEIYSSKVKYSGRDVLYSIVHDITNRKIAEEKLTNSQQELKLLNAQKDKFFSIISHDLKGPIGNFMNFADLLKNHKELLTNESAEALIDHSYNLANNTYKLLENLLVWSKSQLGGLYINQQMIALAPIVDETIELVQDSAKSKGIEIISTIEKTSLIFADKNTILAVLRNLLTNATKFTPKGGKITFSASKCTKNKEGEGYLLISIKDTGVGIPKEKVDDLFTLGKEFSTFGTDNEKGSGLGLILCKELVEKNGGKIWAESKENVGSTFTFSLPCTPKY